MCTDQTSKLPEGLPLFLTLAKAAAVIGLPQSLIEKSFMTPAKRPSYAPPPPPHYRSGRSIYILTEELSAWARSLVESTKAQDAQPQQQPQQTTVLEVLPKKRGRPTNAELHAREGGGGTIQPQMSAKRGRPTNRARAATAAQVQEAVV